MFTEQETATKELLDIVKELPDAYIDFIKAFLRFMKTNNVDDRIALEREEKLFSSLIIQIEKLNKREEQK